MHHLYNPIKMLVMVVQVVVELVVHHPLVVLEMEEVETPLQLLLLKDLMVLLITKYQVVVLQIIREELVVALALLVALPQAQGLLVALLVALLVLASGLSVRDVISPTYVLLVQGSQETHSIIRMPR